MDLDYTDEHASKFSWVPNLFIVSKNKFLALQSFSEWIPSCFKIYNLFNTAFFSRKKHSV